MYLSTLYLYPCHSEVVCRIRVLRIRTRVSTLYLNARHGEVVDRRVEDGDGGVGGRPLAREQVRVQPPTPVVEHLAERRRVDELGREAGAQHVVRAGHALDAVCQRNG